jgi:uncharacterized protein
VVRRLPLIRWAAVAVALAAAAAAAALEVPFLGGRVNDLAGLLSDGFETQLGAELEALERSTAAQVVVLTVPSLEGDPIEDFSMRVAETWKLGGERADNGVLVVIARDERLVRIEVGYGLEGALTDAESGRIISGLMTPRFRAGDFDSGVGAAIDAIAAKLRGEPVELPEERPRNALEGGSSGLVTLILFALFGLPFVNAALVSRGPAGWILSLMLAPFFFIVPAAAFGVAAGAIAVVAWLVLFPILRSIWPKASRVPGRRSMGGRGGIPPFWVGGGSWRGGGGSFGGGFSGGGGSFGGGGATGGW